MGKPKYSTSGRPKTYVDYRPPMSKIRTTEKVKKLDPETKEVLETDKNLMKKIDHLISKVDVLSEKVDALDKKMNRIIDKNDEAHYYVSKVYGKVMR